jgi:small subunit ribosomal protein S6
MINFPFAVFLQEVLQTALTHSPLPALAGRLRPEGKTLAQSKLKPYETVYIIRPNVDEEAVDRTVASVEEFIKAQGGTVETTDKKGRRRLAYEVDKMRDGYFVLTVFHALPETVAALKRMMTISEDIIRSLIVIHEKESAKTL